MSLRIKKIVAREVLLVFVSMVLVLLVYLGSLSYNLFQESQKTHLVNEIDDLRNSDLKRKSKLSNQQRENFIRYLCARNGSIYDPIEAGKFWKRLEEISSNDSIEFKWTRMPREGKTHLIDFGIQTSEDFFQFIESTRMQESELKELDIINGRIAELSSDVVKIRKLNEQEILSNINCALIVVTLCIFVFRYAIYILTWSIETLRNQN